MKNVLKVIDLKTTNYKKLYVFLTIHLLIASINNMIHPAMPAYLKSINLPDYMTGALFASMSLGLFIFAPIWGQLSDKYGRYLLVLGPIGYGVFQYAFSITTNLWLIVLFRFLSGGFAVANATINPAYITDLTSKNDRIKYLGIAALLMPISTSIGFYVGGSLPIWLKTTNYQIIFTIQSILSIGIGLITFLVVKDARNGDRSKKLDFNIISKNIDIFKRYKQTPLRYIIFLTFLNFIAFHAISTQISPILVNSFGYTPQQSGTFSAIYNLAASFSSLLIQRKFLFKIENKYQVLPIAAAASFFAGLLSLTYQVNPYLILLITFSTLAVINTIFVTVIQDLITSFDINNERGALMGTNHAGQSLGMFFGSLSGGFIFAAYQTTTPIAPIIFGLIIFGAVYIYNQMILQNKIKQYNLSNKEKNEI